MLSTFLFPYKMMLISASNALFQALNGLGIVSTSSTECGDVKSAMYTCLSSSEAVQSIETLLSVFFILLIPALMLSSWLLAGRKGIIICLILPLLPGVASVLDILPSINWLHGANGTGSIGDTTGFVCLIFIGLLCGWSITVLVSDIFGTGERFRQWFDIVFILTLVINGIFWVADKEVTAFKADYSETARDINGAARYLHLQVQDYSHLCEQNGLTSQVSCKWASYVQEKLNDIATLSPTNMAILLPENMTQFYEFYNEGKKIDATEEIRRELYNYNRTLCPVMPLTQGVRLPTPSTHCQTPPAVYCSALQTGEFSLSPVDSVAIANECVITSILRYRAILEQSAPLISENVKQQHYRWLWFIVLSFLVGGKITNVMTKMVDFENRPTGERKRVITLISQIIKRLYRLSSYKRKRPKGKGLLKVTAPNRKSKRVKKA